LKIDTAHNDIHAMIDNLAIAIPFGFGGWFAMTKGIGWDDAMPVKGTALGLLTSKILPAS
jgi:hypothetical protein